MSGSEMPPSLAHALWQYLGNIDGERSAIIVFMQSMASSDGKNHPPSDDPIAITSMAMHAPGGFVKGAYKAAEYIASGQVIEDAGNLYSLLASEEETLLSIGIQLAKGMKQGMDGFLDKVEAAGDDSWERGALAGKAGGEYLGEMVVDDAVTRSAFSAIKKTIKVVVAPSIAHAAKGADVGKLKNIQIWTAIRTKSPVKNAYDHWKKHAKKFMNLGNAKQYVNSAHDFIRNPPQGTLMKTRGNGDTILYPPPTNTFAVKTVNGVPKTMFRPNPADHGYRTNLEYFNAQ